MVDKAKVIRFTRATIGAIPATFLASGLVGQAAAAVEGYILVPQMVGLAVAGCVVAAWTWTREYRSQPPAVDGWIRADRITYDNATIEVAGRRHVIGSMKTSGPVTIKVTEDGMSVSVDGAPKRSPR